jgi:hypothetical protein
MNWIDLDEKCVGAKAQGGKPGVLLFLQLAFPFSLFLLLLNSRPSHGALEDC